MVEIKTERLLIRPFSFEDAPFILKLLNGQSFIENIGDKGVRNINGARNYLKEGPMASYERFGFGLWRVGLSVDDTAIGMAGLLKREYLEDIDIGYALLPAFCRMGYAFEATSAVMDYARKKLKIHRVVAIVKEDNASSIRLLEKLGFEGDGTIQMPDTNNNARLFTSASSLSE